MPLSDKRCGLSAAACAPWQPFVVAPGDTYRWSWRACRSRLLFTLPNSPPLSILSDASCAQRAQAAALVNTAKPVRLFLACSAKRKLFYWINMRVQCHPIPFSTSRKPVAAKQTPSSGLAAVPRTLMPSSQFPPTTSPFSVQIIKLHLYRPNQCRYRDVEAWRLRAMEVWCAAGVGSKGCL